MPPRPNSKKLSPPPRPESQGWTLGDTYLVRPQGTAYSNYTDSATRFPLYMKVEGTTNPEVLVSISDVTVTEGIDETADFVVSLSQATSGPVQVSYENI